MANKPGAIKTFKTIKAFKDFTEAQKEWQVSDQVPEGFSYPSVAEDLWKHKETGMRCHTCMYFVPKIDTLGRCRAHAPTMKGWPPIYEQDWCGDHKLSKDMSKCLK